MTKARFGGVAAGTVVLALLVFLLVTDASWLKPHIEAATEAYTGRKVQIGGAFELNLLPTPTVLAEGVSLNKTGALLSGGAAAVTGGLSLLAKAAFDRARGNTDRCAAALAATGGHPPLAARP
jgi:uncharacterized protein involved in outer membrane biogenesis